MNKKAMLLLFAVVSFISNAQLTGVGIQPKLNIAKQLFIDQSLDLKFAIQGSDHLSSIGVDFFTDYQFSDRLKLRGKLGVESKGFAGHFISVNEEGMAHNKLSYFSLDMQLNYSFLSVKKSDFYLAVGLSNGYLFKRKLSRTNTYFDVPFYPIKILNYDAYNLGSIIGLGWSIGNTMWLELEWNRDLIAPAKSKKLKVYNSVYAVNVGINIFSLLKNSKVNHKNR